MKHLYKNLYKVFDKLYEKMLERNIFLAHMREFLFERQTFEWLVCDVKLCY